MMQMRCKILLLATMAVFALVAPVHAAQFVVDNGNPRAADTNPGTAARPFKTIQQAANVAQAGDVVLIRPGVYAESITVRHTGTATHPITFQATRWHGATIQAPDEHTYTIFHPGAQPNGSESYYVTLRGIIFGHTAFRPWSGGNDLPPAVGICHGWRMEDCVVRNNDGVMFGNWAHGDSNGFTLLRTIFDGGYLGGAGGGGAGDTNPLTNVRVIHCIFRRNNPGNLDPFANNGANKFLFTKNLLFDGVISYDNNGSGSWLDTANYDFTIRDCTFFGNHAGYAVDMSGEPIGADESPIPGFATEANKGYGLLEHNAFYSNLGTGLADWDSGSKGCITIHDNWFVDNRVRGLTIRGMADMNANYGNIDRKSGANVIEETSVGTGGAYGSWAADDRTVTWSSGTPTPAAPHDHGYIWQNAVSGQQGWSFTAPADTTTRTFCVYAGGVQAIGTLTAHLSDGSAPDYTTTRIYHKDGIKLNLYSIAYHAAAPGQQLTVTYRKSGQADGRPDGAVDLDAVWLAAGGDAGSGLTGTVSPAAASYDLSAVGTLDWVHWGRISYGGDRLLGAAKITHNVFKGNALPWGTENEQRVLATPAAMGIVIDDNTYDISPANKGPWASWKPTDAPRAIRATGLAALRARLGVEAHGVAEHVDFRGPLIDVHTYPTATDATHPDAKKLQEVPSQAAERNPIDTAIATQHGVVGQVVTMPVYGHTPLTGTGRHVACQVYDLQCRYVRLQLPTVAAQRLLQQRVTWYAIIEPTYIRVRLTKVEPYDVEGVFIQ
jgi:hypothetical protein